MIIIGKKSTAEILTVVAAQVEVAVDQRGAVVEVLRHVVQPVGLHPLHALVPVLHLQGDLHGVVLGLALPHRRVVEQGQQLHPWRVDQSTKLTTSTSYHIYIYMWRI